MIRLATKFRPDRVCFERAVSTGFQHAEIYTNRDVLSASEDVIAIAKDYPLGYAIHFPNRGKFNTELLERAVAIYRDLGCSAMVIHLPMYRKYAKLLLEIDPSLRLAVENHHQTRDEWDDWATNSRWLTLDVEHCWKFTLRDSSQEKLLKFIRRFLKKYGDRLAHVHLPGYVPGFDEHRPQYCSREMVFGLFSLLSEFGYSAKVVSEVNAEYQTANDLRMDVLMFQQWHSQSVLPLTNDLAVVPLDSPDVELSATGFPAIDLR